MAPKLFQLLFLITLTIPSGAVAAESQTTVRIQGDPAGTFETGVLGIHVTSVRVTAKNVGSVAAQSVSVLATLPDGQTVSLRGPRDLGPNKTGTFTASTYERVTSKRKIQASASCSNCR